MFLRHFSEILSAFPYKKESILLSVETNQGSGSDESIKTGISTHGADDTSVDEEQEPAVGHVVEGLVEPSFELNKTFTSWNREIPEGGYPGEDLGIDIGKSFALENTEIQFSQT